MSTRPSRVSREKQFVGNDRVLFGIIFGVLAFWLFAQTTLNISSVMADDLAIETSVMNIAVSITALFSGIFIVVIGSLADRFGRVKMVQIGFVLSIIGSLLVAGGLYLIGEFGFRIFDVMLNGGGQPSPWDIAWTSTGAGLIFIAVLLNGWSPWATLIPGIALTAAGVWSIAWYDGADRVASSIDRLFARPEMVVWGITGWLLVLGLMLLGASGAAIIARAAGRRRPRAVR